MTALWQRRRRLCLTLCHQIIMPPYGKSKHSLPGVRAVISAVGRRCLGLDVAASKKAEVKTKEPSCAFVDSFLMRPLAAAPLSSKLSRRRCLHLFRSTWSQISEPREAENSSLVEQQNSQAGRVFITANLSMWKSRALINITKTQTSLCLKCRLFMRVDVTTNAALELFLIRRILLSMRKMCLSLGTVAKKKRVLLRPNGKTAYCKTVFWN